MGYESCDTNHVILNNLTVHLVNNAKHSSPSQQCEAQNSGRQVCRLFCQIVYGEVMWTSADVVWYDLIWYDLDLNWSELIRSDPSLIPILLDLIPIFLDLIPIFLDLIWSDLKWSRDLNWFKLIEIG